MFLLWFALELLEHMSLLICLFGGSVEVHVSRVGNGVVGTTVAFDLSF